MIITRAPLRISFIGGGTDLPGFYQLSTGRVISATIDQYVYTVVNRTPLIKKVSARYSTNELVDHPRELKNDRIREALLDMGLLNGIEVGTFSHLPGGTGLGSSSSFSVGLIKALSAAQGKKISNYEAAEAASRLEIELVGEPIGKQDQYAAAFGGMNIFQFNSDGSVDVSPVLLDYRKQANFEKRLLVFFTGITRAASSVLNEQSANTERNMSTLQEMAAAVFTFRDLLLAEDFAGMGRMLHQHWLKKRSLASSISNSLIDELYQVGIDRGAWGGKVLGAGGGGCLLFMVDPSLRSVVKEAVVRLATSRGLDNFNEIPVKFVQSGVEIIINSGVVAEPVTV